MQVIPRVVPSFSFHVVLPTWYSTCLSLLAHAWAARREDELVAWTEGLNWHTQSENPLLYEYGPFVSCSLLNSIPFLFSISILFLLFLLYPLFDFLPCASNIFHKSICILLCYLSIGIILLSCPPAFHLPTPGGLKNIGTLWTGSSSRASWARTWEFGCSASISSFRPGKSRTTSKWCDSRGRRERKCMEEIAWQAHQEGEKIKIGHSHLLQIRHIYAYICIRNTTPVTYPPFFATRLTG